jgi:DNA invertase Pin-like site-specific DNA recombinase
MRVGYVRVSSVDQNTARQLDGVEVERTYTDAASGKDTARPKLEELLRFVRDGDTVVVHSMDRLARNLEDLRRLVRGLTDRGVRVEFVKEGLTFTGEDSAVASLLLSMLGAVAEFERALILERQREGIAAAKARGVYTGRRPSLDAAQVVELRRRAAAGERKAALAREYRVSRETVYAYLRAGDAAGDAEGQAVGTSPAPSGSTDPVVAEASPGLVAPDAATVPDDSSRQDTAAEAELAAVLDRLPPRMVARPEPDVVRYDVLLSGRETGTAAAAADTATSGRVVDLSAELGAPAGTWRLTETEPGAGSWIVRRDGTRVGVVRREATSRGRRAWLARLETGVPLPATDDLAAPGSTLWRSRDLAAAGIAHHLTQQQRSRRRR